MAASFIVPPQSLKVPPSALLRQVLFIMLAIAAAVHDSLSPAFPHATGNGRSDAGVRTRGGLQRLGPHVKTSSVMITPSSGGVTKPAITVNVSITQ